MFKILLRCKTEKDTTFYHVTRPSAGPAPLTQPPVPTQDFTDDDEKMKQQPIYDLPVKKQVIFSGIVCTVELPVTGPPTRGQPL